MKEESLEYLKVLIPKQDWDASEEKPSISKEIMAELKKIVTEFTDNKRVDVRKIQTGLRSINFHKEHPDIYAVIEKMNLESDISGKNHSVENFINYINNSLGDNTTRNGVAKIFETMMDKKAREVTPSTLYKVIETTGDQLSREDVEYVMKIIVEPSKDINITSDEFYYVMTKRPADVDMITKVTKKIQS